MLVKWLQIILFLRVIVPLIKPCIVFRRNFNLDILVKQRIINLYSSREVNYHIARGLRGTKNASFWSNKALPTLSNVFTLLHSFIKNLNKSIKTVDLIVEGMFVYFIN